MRLRLVIAATIAALVPSLLAGVSAPAHADTKSTKSSTIYQAYAETVMTRFYSPNICVQTKFLGVISYRRNVTTWNRTEGDTLYLYFIDKFRLSNNTLTTRTFKPEGASCTSTPKRYTRLRTKLKSGAYDCSLNPSISVGAPWSVGVSFWPECGRKELAGWARTDTDGGSYFKMSNSKEYISGYGEEKNWSPTKRSDLTWACAAFAADVTPSTGTAVDTKTTRKVKACPVWNGSTAGF